MESIRTSFNEMVDVPIDSTLANRVISYSKAFANKNEDHIEFFGGNLIGVHRVRFTTQDRDRWFDTVLQTHEDDLKDVIHDLDTVNTSWLVSSDIFNLSTIWVVHALETSKLSKKEKEQAMFESVMVLQYKFITSMLAHWFRYRADPAIAEATYAALSNRFGLKIHGTWYNLLKYRANETLALKGLWQDVITKMEPDERVLAMVNYIQVSIKDILKNVTEVFYRVRDDASLHIRTQSSVISDLDGELRTRDIEKHQPRYSRYINTVIMDKGSFIKSELMDAVTGDLRTVPVKQLTETLIYMSENYGPKLDKRIAKFLDLVLEHFFETMEALKPSERRLNDLPGILSRMKGLYLASKSTNPLVMEVKKLGEDIVKSAVRTKNAALVNSIRTGIILYVILRTFTMHHYSK